MARIATLLKSALRLATWHASPTSSVAKDPDCPISKLTVELLALVFSKIEEVQADDNIFWSRRRFFTHTLVCKHWHKVARLSRTSLRIHDPSDPYRARLSPNQISEMAAKVPNITHLAIRCRMTCTEQCSVVASFSKLTSLSLCRPVNFGWTMDSLHLLVSHCTGLTSLSLDGLSEDGLTILPDSISSLSSLQRLTLQRFSSLTSLPLSVTKLTALQRLEVLSCGNFLLPSSLSHIESFESLTLDGVRSAPPNQLPHFAHLQQLHIGRMEGIANFLSQATQLSTLRVLHIYDNNHLCSLPQEIDQLVELQELHLFSCPLKLLPPSLCHLPRLERLVIHGAPDLLSLPDAIGQLSSLRELRITQGRLLSLPDSISSLSRLNLLCCSSSHLSRLPSPIGHLPQLHHLLLHGCSNLSSLPRSTSCLTSLRSLDLGGCRRLTALPRGMGQLKQLRRLNVKGCEELRKVPVTVVPLLQANVKGLKR